MYDYNEACPISMAASVLCERWTLQIIREMFFGSTRYSEIQKFIPNISPSLLRNRLRFLEEQGLIVRKRATHANRYEYFLTPSGKALGPVLTEMGKWSMRWARAGMTDKQNTAAGLVRDFAGRLDVDELPSCDTSIRFQLTDVEKSPTLYTRRQGPDLRYGPRLRGGRPDHLDPRGDDEDLVRGDRHGPRDGGRPDEGQRSSRLHPGDPALAAHQLVHDGQPQLRDGVTGPGAAWVLIPSCPRSQRRRPAQGGPSSFWSG